jgi:hypothetical protein
MCQRAHHSWDASVGKGRELLCYISATESIFFVADMDYTGGIPNIISDEPEHSVDNKDGSIG